MWWDSLSTFQQVMFVLAVSGSAVMLIFILLMVIGFDQSDFDGVDGIDGVDMQYDSINDEPLSSIGGLRILSVRGVLAFISIGGWAAFIFADVVPIWAASLIAFGFGLLAAYLVALAFRAIFKLESSGNLDYANSIGKIGTVYMRVPKNKTGKGKISLIIQERLVEADAVTDEDHDLLPKTEVEVTGVIDTTILVVKSK
ncbi:MAG: hypothetical protein K9L02_01770 [Acholeplasmataceae bacterium]|nr:hypothetical protein [Acholeplasmataceae bacterium]